jgi:hypothetical protein
VRRFERWFSAWFIICLLSFAAAANGVKLAQQVTPYMIVLGAVMAIGYSLVRLVLNLEHRRCGRKEE